MLGRVKFSAALDGTDEYRTKLKLDGSSVVVDLYTDHSGSLGPCLVRARRIVENFPTIKTKAHTYIAKAVLPKLKLTFGNGLKPLSIDQITSKLKLRFITTHPEPRATFWFEVGNLLAGHGLQLVMADRNRFVDYDTPG